MDRGAVQLPSTYIEFALEKADEAKDSKPADFTETNEFILGGRRWRIRCYPNGDGSLNAGYVSVILRLMDVAQEVRVRFIVESSSIIWGDEIRCRREFTFGTKAYSNGHEGFGQFIPHDKLCNRMDSHKKVRIACTVVVLSDDGIDVPASDICSDLDGLLTDFDVTFSINGGETLIHAHRCVMAARSKFFASLLNGQMVEAGNNNQVVPVTVGSAETFSVLVRFAYADSLPRDEDFSDPIGALGELLRLADFYGMDRMKSCCAARLWDATTKKTAFKVLCSASIANCKALEDKCGDLLHSSEDDIMRATFSGPYFSAASNDSDIPERMRKKSRIDQEGWPGWQ
jgi:speckle-type POZ protein